MANKARTALKENEEKKNVSGAVRRFRVVEAAS
jgi:hypothetical protein